MKKHFLSLFVLIFSAQLLWAADVTTPSNLPAYYSGYIDNKSGSALFDGIHNVAGIGFSSLSYAGVWVAYKTTDTKADGTNIYDYYSYCSDYTYYSSQDGKAPSNTKEGDCYNREHSIPKSWFGGTTSTGTPGTDLFHLVPADKIVNSLRNNHAYGEVTEANATSKTKQGCGTKENPLDNYNRYGQASSITISNTIISPDASTKTPTVKVFEPLAEYKGDLARGYFGTMIKWAGEKWNDGKEQTFTIGDGAQMFSDGYTAEKLFGLSEYGVALLLKWHREDPVSQREIDRNNGIQETQGNRNPFIDYPILAEYIWGRYTGEVFLLSNAVGSFDPSFEVGKSDGDKNGSVVPTTKYTITWSVKGETSSDKVAQGTRPTAPNVEDCSASRVFMGWTTSSSFTGVPSPLYAANEIPNATVAATYYAVFADKEGSGSTSTESVTFSNLYSADTDVENTSISIGANSSVTFKKGTSNSKYYQSGTSIRWYAGGKCTVSSSSGNISKIVFTFASGGNTNEISTTIGTYNDNDGIWKGDANSVEFTQAGASGHRRIASISVTSGTEASYSNYSTMCETCTPTMPEVSFAASEKSTTCGGEVTNALNKGGSEGTVTYTSSNTSVATVGKSTGSVTIISAGTTIITANVAASGCYSSALASYTLTVNRENAMVNFISPTTELQEKLKTTNEAYTSSDAEISYASNNESVAIVDVETGEVTAIAPGIARITASVAQTGCYNEASAYYDLSVTAIPTYTVTWKANGETVWVTENVKTDDLYSLPDNPENCSEERVFMGWTVEKDYESETTAPSLITSIYQAPILTQDTTIYAVYADKKTTGNKVVVTDSLTRAFTGISGTSYSSWTNKVGSSGAVYAGNSAGGNNAIQMRTDNNNSGIITTTSAGTVTNVTLLWNSGTNTTRVVSVYGKNTAYSSAEDLYSESESTRGTLLGTMKMDTKTSLDVDGTYTYIGIRSKSGALYLDSVLVTWSVAGGGTETNYSNYSLACEKEVYDFKALEASDVTYNSFVANWTEAEETEYYKLDVMTAQESISPQVTTFYTKDFSESLDGWDVDYVSGYENVWIHNTKYGQVVATSYVSNVRYDAESWLISPSIDLTEAITARLTLNNVFRYGSTVYIMISTDGGNNWTPLSPTNWSSASNWNFVDSEADLSSYIGKTVKIGLKYVGTTDACPTWEVKSLIVSGTAELPLITHESISGYPIYVNGTSKQVSDLNSETTYYYTVTPLGGTISNEIEVTTQKYTEPTAVENVESVHNARKVLIDGKMYIFIGEHCYDVTGKRIR